MLSELAFSADDLALTRFAISPMLEVGHQFPARDGRLRASGAWHLDRSGSPSGGFRRAGLGLAGRTRPAWGLSRRLPHPILG